LFRPTLLDTPTVIAAQAQENGKLSGDASTLVTVTMTTGNENVAPYFNVNNAQFETSSFFIDYQDSDNSTVANRNTITTVDFVAETEADGGTVASKHLTIPYTLSNSSTSIVVLVDAVRPVGADFDIWYRTNLSDTDDKLSEQDWVAFGKEIKVTKSNSYNDIPPSDNLYMFTEYEFSVFDLSPFDEYQIKITMNSTNSTRFPRFKNLRTIATS